LKALAFDFVKIDGVIIQNMLRNPAEMSKVRAMICACEQLGVRTVAEFVDDKAILPVLRKIGIDYAQGFSVARPGRLFGRMDAIRSAAGG
jgi:EAL domain-containing protein (putative c-di-GMP-specific phosphodiesterase class I)